MQYFLSALPPPPQPPYGRLSYVFIIVGTIEDCIRGVQIVGVQKKKDRGCLLLSIKGGGEGGATFIAPPTNE